LAKKILLVNQIERENHITNGFINIELNDYNKQKIQQLLPNLTIMLCECDNQRLYIYEHYTQYQLLHYQWIDYIETCQDIYIDDIITLLIQLLYHNIHLQSYGINFVMDNTLPNEFEDLLFYNQRKLIFNTLNYLDQQQLLLI
jgi:hypothetical protein